jgi:tripartite-type tricarboxylate transporter receptor subunit TctC
MGPIGFVRGQIEAGAIRPLMVLGYNKSVVYPDLPTLGDKKLDLPVPTWTALFATGGTPKAVIDRLAAEISLFAKSPEAQAKQKAGEMIYYSSTPEAFARRVQSEARRYQEIADSMGWKPQ